MVSRVVSKKGDMASVKPIIFVLGPSGVGKSHVSEGLANDYSFWHFDIDQNRGFKANGFPAEWDEDIQKIDFGNLATTVRHYPAVEQRAGAVLSFPTVHVFSPKQLEASSRVGISTVVLWGKEEHWESPPVTIKFSDAVGEILISNPTVTEHRPNFKFYI